MLTNDLFQIDILNILEIISKLPIKINGEINRVVSEFEINNSYRLVHFLSQCDHESMGFKVTEENLKYSAKGLLTIFPKYFKFAAEAKLYEKQPEKIANRVYADRMGNGNTQSGDGYKFRGRGYIQLTGKYNYQSFGNFIKEDVVSNPDVVSNKHALLSAAWFWKTNGINEIANLGTSIDVIKKVTKKINGGYNGLDDRILKFNAYYKLICER